MNLNPQPLEEKFRVARLKAQLKEIDREDLEEFTGRLLEIASKLTHQTKQLLAYVEENEKKNSGS